jgi:hypothetical protein
MSFTRCVGRPQNTCTTSVQISMQLVHELSYETVAWIFESRLDIGILQSQQYRVYVYTLEAFVEHLRLLLGISRSSMQLVLFLNSNLHHLLSRCQNQMSGYRTGSSSHAAINASYGLLKEEVETPVRSSNVLTAWLDMMLSYKAF